MEVVAVRIPLRPAAVAIAHPLLPTAGAAAVRTAGVNRGLKKSIFVFSSMKKSEDRSQESEEKGPPAVPFFCHLTPVC